MSLEADLRALRDAGRKILAPYVMCGFPSQDVFGDLVAAVVDAGADMLEIGVPYSDPLMDGPVIQHAGDVALRGETRPGNVLQMIDALDVRVPLVVMTYVNPVMAMGETDFAAAARAAGARGVIVPDLPVEEAGPWVAAARAADLAPVFLAGPTTTGPRMRAIAEVGSGFVYCVSLLGVTGERASLSERAKSVVDLAREHTDRPALVGIGVSTPEHAAEACSFADGVVVGSALISALERGGVPAAVELIASMREAMDG